MEYGLGLKWLAVFFAVATVISSFGSGNMPQANNMASGIETSFGVPSYLSGLIFAGLMGFVIVGGVRRIAAVAAALVPTMAMLYALGAFAVIFSNLDQVIPAFSSVFEYAFTGSAAAGGFWGRLLLMPLIVASIVDCIQMRRARVPAPIAHAAAKTKSRLPRAWWPF